MKRPLDMDLGCPRVYAVILNWKRYELTSACVRSLQASDYSNLCIVIVDNCSNDGSAAKLRDEFPGLTILVNDSNLGFARGCNVGIRVALEDANCAYVLLVNNDSTVNPTFLRYGLEAAGRDPSVGVVGGKVLRGKNDPRIWYAGGRISRWRGAVVTRGSGEIDQGQYDTSEYVEFVTCAFMLIRREALLRAGLLPEEYFFGVEEWDFSMMVARAGFKLLYEPKMMAYHEGDGSHHNYDPAFVYNYYRNKLIFQQKYLPRWLFGVWRFALVVYARYLARLNRLRLHRFYAHPKPDAPEDLDFAFSQAVEDHRKVPLDERALQVFRDRLVRIHGEAR